MKINIKLVDQINTEPDKRNNTMKQTERNILTDLHYAYVCGAVDMTLTRPVSGLLSMKNATKGRKGEGEGMGRRKNWGSICWQTEYGLMSVYVYPWL